MPFFVEYIKQNAIATVAKIIQKIITVFQVERERIPPAIWLATAQPIYAVALRSPATVLTLPYFANLSGTIVISITFTANIQLVTIIIDTSERTRLFDENAKRTIKNTSAMKKKRRSFCFIFKFIINFFCKESAGYIDNGQKHC